ncbi:hypothetical protein M0R45_035695 [Rubus argutus]|uniref:Uncharacterized protein n=1 Tax=Rubus argutus TaxID=59490 RepID=A0AAW1VV04_RUBAR
MVAESWFRSLWRTKKKHEAGPEKAVIGVLAFEVASLMSKLVQLWQLLSDKQVARLWKNCSDPSLKGFEHAISDLMNNGVDPYGWVFSWKKMKRKAKKMEKFISINANLYGEMEVLSDLEQILRRMKGSDDLDGVNLPEFEKKVVWRRQEVKNLKEVSLWNRTYDYTVLLLARSLVKIFSRIKHALGIQQMADGESKDSDHISRSQSISAETIHLLPIVNYLRLNGVRTAILNVARDGDADILASGNKLHPSPSIFSSKHKLLDAPPDTLGAAALALHYANVVIVIEKLVASPHLIGLDARDDLYNMLPASVRAALRERLKPFSKSLSSAVYDTVLAGEWNVAMAGILEWLAPLAHNMIRWQSERSFEQQTLVSRTHVLLVQTLYFANQQKTEATITELLVGLIRLNYIWRFGREVNAKALLDCDSSRTYDEFLDMDG